MRLGTWCAIVGAFIATANGVGAADYVPQLYGDDALNAVMGDVMATCSANVRTQIGYVAVGSTTGEVAMNSGLQAVAPMTRALGRGICANSLRDGAEGLVIGLDAVDVLGDATQACQSVDYSGANGKVGNDWRSVLRLVYAGMGPTGSDILTRSQ